MPIMPTYESKRNINARTAEPLRNEASQKFKPMQEVVGAIQQVTQAWSDANDVMQSNEAKGMYETEVTRILAAASEDNDYKNSNKYFKELQDAKNNSLDGISNKMVQENLSMEMDFGNQMAGIKIDTNFKKKQIAANRFGVAETIKDLQVKRMNASPSEAMQYDAMIKSELDANVAIGVYSQEEALKIYDDSLKLAVQYDIYADPATTEEDSAVLAELRDTDGKYKDVSAEERLGLIKDSQRRIFQNNQTLQNEYKKSKKSRIENIYEQIDAKTLTFADLDAEKEVSAEKDGIPSKTLQIIEKGQRNELLLELPLIATKHDSAVKYINAMTDYVDNIDDQNKIMEYIATAYEVGGLNPQESKFLEDFHAQAMGIKDARNRANFMQNNFIPFKNSINAFTKFMGGVPLAKEEDHAMALHSMIIDVTKGVDPIQAKNDAILKFIQKSNPDISNFSEEGQPVMDANGNTKIMYPDGKVKGENK